MYSLKDLVLFNTEGWFGLYQTVNSQYWPLQILGLAWGLFVIYAFFTREHSLIVIAFVSSAGLWLSCAIVFHLGEYQQLSWVAVYYGWTFIAQAIILFLSAALNQKLEQKIDQKLGKNIGQNIFGSDTAKQKIVSINVGRFLLCAGIAMIPILGLIEGRNWMSLDILGVGPDSTALATTGLVLLAVRSKVLKILLCIIPTMWLIISAATAWPMGLFQGVVSLFIWLLCVLFLFIFNIKKNETGHG